MTLLAFSIRASVLLALALGLVRMMPRRSAAARHWVVAVAIVGVAVLPLLQAIAPAWSVPLTLSSSTVAPGDTSLEVAHPDSRAHSTRTAAAPTTGRWMELMDAPRAGA